MYLSYYKLNKKPFQINTDPHFFWLGEKHKEALSLFTYGVSSDKGFMLLTGDVGTGKTTLINAFVNSLGDQVIVARVSDPGLPRLGFLKYIAEMFNMETDFETKNEFLIRFTGFLEQAYADGKNVLLVIDEAQHLNDETLEEIRLLSNIERQDKKLLNIFLVGQNEFNDTLNKHKNRALRQRLAINSTLYPFEPEETRACIGFRLAVAGATKEIFTPEAITAIHTISKGFPRAINIICDHALLLGSQQEQEIITEETVQQCSKTLHAHLPESHQQKSDFGSTDHWLEDSEVPPLSIEALDRASQPLPEIRIADEKEPAGNSRKKLIIVSLFIAVLILSGIFAVKNGTLDSISQFVVNRYKEITAPTKEKEAEVSVPAQTVKETEIASSREVAAKNRTIIPAPGKVVQTEEKPVARTTGLTETGESTDKTTQAEPDEPTFTEQPATDVSLKPIEKAKTGEETETSPPSSLEVELPTEPAEETLKTGTQEDLAVSAPETSLTVEQPSTTEEPSTALEKERITGPEIIELQPEPAVSQTTTEAINDDFNKQAPLPREPAALTAKEVEPPPSTKKDTKMATAPREPVVTPAEARPKAEEDPGAVIDWLLKSRKNE